MEEKTNGPLLEDEEIQEDEDFHEKEEKKGKKGEEVINKEEKDEEDEESKGNEMIEINEKARRTIYICLVLVSLFSSCDGGIIPQQNSKIQTDFVGDENDNSLVGFFGSVDYIGRVIGALIFAVIMGKMNRKKLLIATLILKSITLFIALPFKNSTINIIFRGISGISQVFYTSYLPVWCDQYGKKKHRALMVTIVQLGNPIGIILGYGMGMLCDTFAPEGYSGWRISFAIEGAILIVCALIILGFKKKYFSEKFVLLKDNFGKEEVKEEEENSKIINTKNIGKIICNKIFFFTTLSNSVSFFGMGIVQYWGDKYMELVLKIDTTIRFILFSALCLLGPILGMIFGGVVCSKLGGYNKRRAMTFTIILLIISSVVSSLITIGNNIYIFVIFAWVYLFFICAAIPPESGIIIVSLDNNLRGDGFSLSNSILNLTGSFPSSYAFGGLLDFYEKKLDKEDIINNKHYVYSMISCMAYNFAGVLFIIIAGIFRFRIKGDLSNTGDIEEIEEAKSIGIDRSSTLDSKSREG